MKKLLIVLFLIFFLGSSNLWAFNEGYAYAGISGMGAGASLLVLAPYMEPVEWMGYTLGGLFAAGGLVLFIAAFFDNTSSYAMLENNAIIKHTSFTSIGDKLFLGTRFRL